MNAPSQRRTVILTERVLHFARLAPADVALLVEQYRGKIEVLPTGRRDRYHLRSLGWVGKIITPGCRFVIRPKIPLVNVLRMLDPSSQALALPDTTSPVNGTELLEFLTGQLLSQLRERLSSGLHRAFREREVNGSILQGRLNLPAQNREAPGRKDRLHCLVDDWTVDITCNRLIRATVELLLASPLLSSFARAALRQTLVGLEGVSPLDLSSHLWLAVADEHIPEGYQTLLDLCHLLAESLEPGITTGSYSSLAFLLDMERVFERYILKAILERFLPHLRLRVSVQRTWTVNQPVADQNDITMRPDLIIDNEVQRLVVDAKWKHLTIQADTEDLYQMLAYGTALGARELVLLYPGKRWSVREYAFNHSPLRLSMLTIRVGGSRRVCDRSLERLGRLLHTRLRGT